MKYVEFGNNLEKSKNNDKNEVFGSQQLFEQGLNVFSKKTQGFNLFLFCLFVEYKNDYRTTS